MADYDQLTFLTGLDDKDFDGPSYAFISFPQTIRHQQAKGNKIVFLYMPLCTCLTKEEMLNMRGSLPQFQASISLENS